MEETDLKRALTREYIPKPDVKAEWERLSSQLDLEPETARTISINKNRRTMVLSFIAGVAASAAVFFVISLLTRQPAGTIQYAFTATEQPKDVMVTTADGTIHPAQDMLGKEHTLAKADVRTASPKPCSLITPRGKDYQLTLADGTKVWMNADSRLDFPDSFVGKTRKVRLKGEAFFEVAKDKEHPFIVETDYFSTTVLGTSFNVRAYSERTAAVVLVEGSVQMQAGQLKQLLEPDQKWSMVNGRWTVSEVDTYPYTQWRDGFFYFDNASLYEIMQELGRWYNVNIAFDEPDKMNTRLHFVAQRNGSLREAIGNLNALGTVHISYEKGLITIK